MAGANITTLKNEVSIKNRKDSNNDLFLQTTIMLDRAHGVLDLLFTMENETCLGGLSRGSLSGALDSAMSQIEEARILITKMQS